MKTLFLALFVLLLIFAPTTGRAVTELSGEFGYSKQVYGAQKQNDTVTRTYSTSVAFYFLTMTAVEFNYYESDEITDEHNTINVSGTNVDVIGVVNRVNNYSYGLGIRQALAPRKAFLVPTLSLGYARQFVSDSTTFTFRDNTSGAVIVDRGPESKVRNDSVFGTFALQMRISKRLSLRGSVNTIFPAFETDRIGDNLRYTVGFTWYLF